MQLVAEVEGQSGVVPQEGVVGGSRGWAERVGRLHQGVKEELADRTAGFGKVRLWVSE